MVELRRVRVLVSGASGPIGTALLPTLKADGAQIARLSRSGPKRISQDEESIPWNPAEPIPPDVVSGFDAVIHLAGESIVGRWSGEKKKKIRDSRGSVSSRVARAMAGTRNKPQVFIYISAIGFSDDRGDKILTEQSTDVRGFLQD